MRKTVERLREILESEGYVVDTAVEPFGTVPGLVAFHKRAQPVKKGFVKVVERWVRYDAAVVRMFTDAQREIDGCQKQKSGSGQEP